MSKMQGFIESCTQKPTDSNQALSSFCKVSLTVMCEKAEQPEKKKQLYEFSVLLLPSK